MLNSTPKRGRAARRPACLIATAALAVACGGRPSGPAGGPPALPVEAVTLAPRPIERSSEYVGIVKSRRSTTVKPQVEGFITRILVSSGRRVEPGTPLMQIDEGKQQAAVASLESQRAARQSDLQYARQQAARTRTLLEAGAASQAELEQAEAGLASSQAQLEAIEAQIREQRVDLGYHLVSAPTAGILGDIPVRVGDSVTRSTALTTIDQQAGLELYINVPVQEAPLLAPGLAVHLLDDDGKIVATEKLTFVAPSVDAGTQSVLAKAALEQASGLRTDQFVRARIVWTEEPTLTVPIVALNRINGQYFAYVAESGEGEARVARQRAVEPGAVVGNDYVLRSGLQPGETLIVSGVQKLRDGTPVAILPPAPASSSSPPPVPGGGRE